MPAPDKTPSNEASSRDAAELAWELFDGWKLAAEHAMGYSADTNVRIEAWIEAKRLEVGSVFGARRPTETPRIEHWHPEEISDSDRGNEPWYG